MDIFLNITKQLSIANVLMSKSIRELSIIIFMYWEEIYIKQDHYNKILWKNFHTIIIFI